jgi:hypothetical protein
MRYLWEEMITPPKKQASLAFKFEAPMRPRASSKRSSPVLTTANTCDPLSGYRLARRGKAITNEAFLSESTQMSASTW